MCQGVYCLKSEMFLAGKPHESDSFRARLTSSPLHESLFHSLNMTAPYSGILPSNSSSCYFAVNRESQRRLQPNAAFELVLRTTNNSTKNSFKPRCSVWVAVPKAEWESILALSSLLSICFKTKQKWLPFCALSFPFAFVLDLPASVYAIALGRPHFWGFFGA